jgi:outer membrane protein assembly factor BamD (BamD/ComL family)
MKSLAMIKLLVIIILVSQASCNHSKQRRDSTADKISAIEKALFNESGVYSQDTVRLLMDLYVRYADSLPQDEKSAEYLFKAADLSMYFSEPGRTIWLLDRLMTRYPEHEKAAMSLFLKAFVYDTRFEDTASARHFYRQFIDQYPNHEFAGEAEAAIRNLGKTPEDLIREFEQLNSN